ncbi:methylmalonyl-CoA mutase subunit beta [Altibacter sp. HG106]|uniref:methylmalonyl-CoA mutase subunit beta n=1 Tax=Altibacter sp. HG106 TaxID=3023937 RepID=UPI00300FA740
MSKLFSEFEPVSAKQWKQQIQVDLKGADYNDSLVWSSPEGIDVKPFYHADDRSEAPSPIPGHPKTWNSTASVFVDDVSIASDLARAALDRGAEALYISADSPFDMANMFDAISWDDQTLYFNFQFLSETFFGSVYSYFEKRKATVVFLVDILGNLARTGNWFHSEAKDHEILQKLLATYPDQAFLHIDTTLYQNAGGTMVQQLAYALGQCNEYLNHIAQHAIVPMETLPPVTYSVAVGGNYFFEIAKIRALRKLHAVLASAYDCSEECHIIAQSSLRNKTLYDYNVNMLRTTTEAMSAILGGANSVVALRYDALYHKSNEFGERIARNQLLILKEESYFEAVGNPADGAYYIEEFTEQLAEKALSLFKQLEKSGGLLNQLQEGQLQKKLKERAAEEQDRFDAGKKVLVGTNKYVNEQDRMKDDLELYPFVKIKPRKTLIEPIIPKRLSESVEQNRLKNEA